MEVAAFFDVDGTVLAKNSGPLYLKYLLREGRISKAEMARGLWWFLLYRLGRLNWEKVSPKMVARYEGESEIELIDDCIKWYNEMVKQHVRPEIVDAMDKHRKSNQKVILLTAASIYLTRPLGEDLGVDGYICNYLVVLDGKFTGKLVEPFCYGAGKVVLAEKFASENGIDLSKSYFYSDSITDMPVLERVGNPVIVNPDPVLRRKAKLNGWPLYDYKPPVAFQ